MNWLVDYLRTNKVKRIAYVMNAAKSNLAADPCYIFNDAIRLMSAGFEVIVVDLDGTNNLRETLSNVDAIYVRGGNTFDLLESVKNSDFLGLLNEALERGVIYIGTSAGSILAGPSIEIAQNDFANDPNNTALTDFAALGLVDFAIFPHWQDDWSDKLAELNRRLHVDYKIKTLGDKQIILVKDGKSELIDL